MPRIDPEARKEYELLRLWKKAGLVGNYDLIYDKYKKTNNCDLCNCEFTKKNVKCMDHSHISGQFRHICCNSCNSNMFDKTIPKHNTSGIKNIVFYNKLWAYHKTYKKNDFRVYNKNKQIVLWVKFYDYLMLSN